MGCEVTGRRRFLQASAAGLTAACLRAASGAEDARPAAASAPARPPRRRPNFLLILTDDQRWDALGAAGNPLIRTPHMDALASRGMRFAQAMVTTSICCPSRACCLTGRYGSRTGVTGVGAGSSRIRPGERTFVQMLREAGYRTGFFGKWHIGGLTPAGAGFDAGAHFVGNGAHYDRQVQAADGPTIARGFIEDWLADRSVEFMESARAAGTPFLLHLCTQVPHMTSEMTWEPRPETLALYDEARMPVPPTWNDDLAGKPPHLKTSRQRTQAATYGYGTPEAIRRHHRLYYAAVTDLDRSLGRVLAALDRLGLRDTTCVLLTGDNGWFLGEHGFTSKVLAYEESVRVPLLVAGPGVGAAVEQRLVLNADLAPTILDLAGLPVPANVHGRSLVPLLGGRAEGWRASVLYEALAPDLGSWPHLAVRTRQWKYIRTLDLRDPSRTVFEELYDLAQDPAETRNLAGVAEHRGVLERQREEIERLRAELQA